MTEPRDGIEERLKRLGQATEVVGPSQGFEVRILAAIEREARVRWFAVPRRAGRLALLVGGLAAAASIALALQSQRELDDDAIVADEWADVGE
jgi:hypothetical protein